MISIQSSNRKISSVNGSRRSCSPFPLRPSGLSLSPDRPHPFLPFFRSCFAPQRPLRDQPRSLGSSSVCLPPFRQRRTLLCFVSATLIDPGVCVCLQFELQKIHQSPSDEKQIRGVTERVSQTLTGVSGIFDKILEAIGDDPVDA